MFASTQPLQSKKQSKPIFVSSTYNKQWTFSRKTASNQQPPKICAYLLNKFAHFNERTHKYPQKIVWLHMFTNLRFFNSTTNKQIT